MANVFMATAWTGNHAWDHEILIGVYETADAANQDINNLSAEYELWNASVKPIPLGTCFLKPNPGFYFYSKQQEDDEL